MQWGCTSCPSRGNISAGIGHYGHSEKRATLTAPLLPRNCELIRLVEEEELSKEDFAANPCVGWFLVGVWHEGWDSNVWRSSQFSHSSRSLTQLSLSQLPLVVAQSPPNNHQKIETQNSFLQLKVINATNSNPNMKQKQVSADWISYNEWWHSARTRAHRVYASFQ